MKYQHQNKKYILEIGKTTATISQYNRLLQRFTLFILIALIVFSIVIDLVYTRILLRPLEQDCPNKIVEPEISFQRTAFTHKNIHH